MKLYTGMENWFQMKSEGCGGEHKKLFRLTIQEACVSRRLALMTAEILGSSVDLFCKFRVWVVWLRNFTPCLGKRIRCWDLGKESGCSWKQTMFWNSWRFAAEQIGIFLYDINGTQWARQISTAQTYVGSHISRTCERPYSISNNQLWTTFWRYWTNTSKQSQTTDNLIQSCQNQNTAKTKAFLEGGKMPIQIQTGIRTKITKVLRGFTIRYVYITPAAACVGGCSAQMLSSHHGPVPRPDSGQSIRGRLRTCGRGGGWLRFGLPPPPPVNVIGILDGSENMGRKEGGKPRDCGGRTLSRKEISQCRKNFGGNIGPHWVHYKHKWNLAWFWEVRKYLGDKFIRNRILSKKHINTAISIKKIGLGSSNNKSPNPYKNVWSNYSEKKMGIEKVEINV